MHRRDSPEFESRTRITQEHAITHSSLPKVVKDVVLAHPASTIFAPVLGPLVLMRRSVVSVTHTLLDVQVVVLVVTYDTEPIVPLEAILASNLVATFTHSRWFFERARSIVKVRLDVTGLIVIHSILLFVFSFSFFFLLVVVIILVSSLVNHLQHARRR